MAGLGGNRSAACRLWSEGCGRTAMTLAKFTTCVMADALQAAGRGASSFFAPRFDICKHATGMRACVRVKRQA
jgi:hypothetical protein